MSRIILIETSTDLCSTALVEDGKIIEKRSSDSPKAHASKTAPFIKDMLDSRGLKVSDCDAVCVGKGPGSYTGLRVGSSTAKGLCFGAGIPLLAVGTLDTLVQMAIEGDMLPEGCRHIVPMIDARRMEVYSAIYSTDGRQLTQTAPTIVDSDTFSAILAEGPALFIGDGALKCKETVASDNAFFVQCCPVAEGMASKAEEAFKKKQFEDIAYFEPFYLKEFVATVSNKKLF